MRRERPPFRADHVGSLLRPPALLARARNARRAASTRTSFVSARTRRSARSYECRRTSACSAATDGEFRRTSWHMDFIYRLGGDHAPATTASRCVPQRGGRRSSSRLPRCTSTARIGISETIFGDAFAFLRDDVTTAVPKLTIPSPSMVHWRGGRAAIDEDVYPDLDALLGRPHGRVPRRRCGASASSAARTSSSTTRASRTSTTRPAGVRRPRSAAIPSAST